MHYAGMDNIKQVYSDNAREITKPVMDIWDGSTVHDRSTPGVPQTNSIAEGKVKKTAHGPQVCAYGRWFAARLLALHLKVLRPPLQPYTTGR